ncbi:MAG TPA: VOC family protein [Burkholderiaceae bacterium]|nr:VOC family protein [Burkholderiaceae bacterium]
MRHHHPRQTDPHRRAALRAGLGLAAALVVSGCETTPGVAPPAGMSISKTPLVGKFVWRDLMTDDPALVKPFYAALFGWEYVERTAQGRPYTLVKSGGQFIGGIAKAERRIPDQPNAQWLSFLSVADVDHAAQQTRSAGGSVVLAPFDLPKVGRAAVVLDPQGAPLGLVRASFGDPADAPRPTLNHFLWTEELVPDPRAAASFYSALAGFEVVTELDGDRPFLLLRKGRDRAAIMRTPIEGMRAQWLVSVMVADPAASAQRAKDLGGKVLVAPHPKVRNGTFALITDPSGALIALQKWTS